MPSCYRATSPALLPHRRQRGSQSMFWSVHRQSDPTTDAGVQAVYHGEVAAATRHTLDSDRTIVKLGKLLHQGQPNAAALVGAAFLPSMRWKPQKCAATHVRNAHAAVVDRERDMIVHFSQADRNLPLESEAIECIGEKIEHDLLRMSRSTYTGSPTGRQSTTRLRPARSQAERKLLARSVVRAARSVDSYVARARPGLQYAKNPAAN